MSRQMSLKQSEIEKPSNEDDLIVPEEKISGGVGYKDYKNLFSFSSGFLGIVICAVCHVLATLTQLAPSYVISAWIG
jgi:hypothetical protein